jgi:AraC family transcriptional regulator
MTAESTAIEASDLPANANAAILPLPPISSSCIAGWKNIHLNHHLQPTWEMPEIADAKVHRMSFDEDKFGCIDILPTNIPFKYSWSQLLEFTICYLEPTFISQVAYESVAPDRVEFPLLLQQPSPLIWQMAAELRSILKRDPANSCFYAEAIATAMAAHLLTNYATRRYVFKEYDGLPKAKLKQAIEYINAHLGENVSLSDIATQLNMSQYHFSRLFKQSTGMPPHTYLIDRRVDRSKQLLRGTELTILEISNECGFANPSHFARCFRQQMGITPMQFRRSA